MKKCYKFSVLTFMFIITLSIPVWAQDPLERLNSLPADRNEAQQILSDVIDQGPTVIPDLIRFLEEDQSLSRTSSEQKREWGYKIGVMNILAEWQATEALGSLERMARSSDDLSAIYNPIRTIGRIGGEQSFQILKQIWEDSNTSLDSRANHRKRAAILGFGLCGNTEAIPFLRQELLNEQNEELTRVYAAGSLGLLGNDEGLQVALSGILSENNRVRLHSIEALGFIGDISSLGKLEELAQPEEKYVYRIAAQAAIIQIETKQFSGNEKVHYIYQKLLEYPNMSELIWWGTSQLKTINSDASRSALESLSKQENSFLQAIAKMKLNTMN